MNTQPHSSAFVLDDLTDEHGKELKDIALSSIISRIKGMKYLPSVNDLKLKEKAGVFVTLKECGGLRGCVGYTQPVYELWDATQKAAVHAAIADPRFRPVEESEIESLEVEISVLGPLQKMLVIDSPGIGILKLGVEGLVVEGMGNSGLLLPQVAIESGMNAMEFLEATCEKAGLPSNAWKFPEVSIYRFPAKIF